MADNDVVTSTDQRSVAAQGLSTKLWHAVRRVAPRLIGPVLVTLAAWFGFCVRLLASTPVGFADQGDAKRLMCPIGLAPSPVDNRPFLNHAFFNYVVLRWDRIPAQLRSTLDCGYAYRTDQRRIVLLSGWISRHLGFAGALDLRVLAVVNCLIIAVAFGLLVAALRCRWWMRLLVAAVLWVVVADGSFLPYATSGYSEIAGLTGMLYALAGAVYLASRSPRMRIVGLVVFTAGASYAILSKVQAVTLVIPCVIYLLAHEVPIGRLRGRWLGRVPAALAVVVLLISSAWVQTGEGTIYKQANRFNFVFLAMLGPSHNRLQDIVDMGGNPELLKWADGRRDFWEIGIDVRKDPYFQQFQSHTGLMAIGGFLVEHPSDLDNVLNNSANSFTDARPNYLGTYPQYSGFAPQQQECRVCVVTDALKSLPKDGFPLLAGMWAGIGLVGWWAALRKPKYPVGRVVVLFLGFGIVQYVTATFGDGIEITKHEVFGIFATAVAAAWALFGLAGTARLPRRLLPAAGSLPWRSRDPHPAADAPDSVAAPAPADPHDVEPGEASAPPREDGEPVHEGAEAHGDAEASEGAEADEDAEPAGVNGEDREGVEAHGDVEADGDVELAGVNGEDREGVEPTAVNGESGGSVEPVRGGAEARGDGAPTPVNGERRDDGAPAREDADAHADAE